MHFLWTGCQDREYSFAQGLFLFYFFYFIFGFAEKFGFLGSIFFKIRLKKLIDTLAFFF